MPKQVDTLFPIAFSNSMLSDLWRCELLWFRKYCQKYTSGSKNPDLIAGGHFAKACELVRKNFHNDGLDVDSAIEIGYNYILEAEDTGHNLKSNERIALALKRYFRTFPLNSNLTPVALANGEYAIEYSFEFDLGIPHPELPETNLTYKGKLDGLYEQKDRAGFRTSISVLDEKTTTSLSRISGTKLVDTTTEENLYYTSGQFIGYHWASRQLGVPTDNSLVRKVPIAATPESAVELNIPITEFQIGVWSATTVNKIEELVDKYLYYKKSGTLPHISFYPIFQDGCNAYKRPCNYNAGCRTEDGEAILASRFPQKVWDSELKEEVSLIDFKKKRGL